MSKVREAGWSGVVDSGYNHSTVAFSLVANTDKPQPTVSIYQAIEGAKMQHLEMSTDNARKLKKALEYILDD